MKPQTDSEKEYCRCAICGCELEMSLDFAKKSGISSTTCIFCRGSSQEANFLSKLSYWKGKELSNKEVREKLQGEGFWVI